MGNPELPRRADSMGDQAGRATQALRGSVIDVAGAGAPLPVVSRSATRRRVRVSGAAIFGPAPPEIARRPVGGSKSRWLQNRPL